MALGTTGLKLGVVLGALALSAAGIGFTARAAQAGVSVGIGVPVAPAPPVAAPPPVAYAPPAYVAPAPAVVAPPPVAYAAPRYVAPVYGGGDLRFFCYGAGG